MAYHISFVERSIVQNLKESIIGIVSSPSPHFQKGGRVKLYRKSKRVACVLWKLGEQTFIGRGNQTYIKEKECKHPNSKIWCFLFFFIFFQICISCIIHAIYSTKMVRKWYKRKINFNFSINTYFWDLTQTGLNCNLIVW